MNAWEQALRERSEQLGTRERQAIQAVWDAIQASGADGVIKPPFGDYTAWYALMGIGLAHVSESGVRLVLHDGWLDEQPFDEPYSDPFAE